jgi:hypothetical protein
MQVGLSSALAPDELHTILSVTRQPPDRGLPTVRAFHEHKPARHRIGSAGSTRREPQQGSVSERQRWAAQFASRVASARVPAGTRDMYGNALRN